MCALMTAAAAMVAGDLAELQQMMLLSTAIGHDSFEVTSTGYRCALDTDSPHHHLAPLAGADLPSTAAGKLYRVLTCTHRTRSHDRSGHHLDSACAGTLMACEGQHRSAQGGLLMTARSACGLSVRVWGWGRRGGSREAHQIPRMTVCYTLAGITFARPYGPM